jgi:hypothetical protein
MHVGILWMELIKQKEKTHYFRCHWNTIKLIARIGSCGIMFKSREKAAHKLGTRHFLSEAPLCKNTTKRAAPSGRESASAAHVQ